MGLLVSRLGAFLSSSCHNSVNFCSIFKIRCQNLSFFHQTKHNFFICLVSKLNNNCSKLCTFLGHPVVCPLAFGILPVVQCGGGSAVRMRMCSMEKAHYQYGYKCAVRISHVISTGDSVWYKFVVVFIFENDILLTILLQPRFHPTVAVSRCC